MHILDSLPRTALRGALGIALIIAAGMPLRAEAVQEARRLFQSGEHAQALARLNKLLAEKPGDAQARFLKGVILADQGNVKEATELFLKLTQDHPELPEPHNNLAVLYASQGQYEKARVALERSIRTHPSYATAYENLGDVYAKLASRAYDKALQLDSANAAAQNKLALARELVGGPPRAQTVAAAAPQLAAPSSAAAQAAEPKGTAAPALAKPGAPAAPAAAKPSPAQALAAAKPGPAEAPAAPAAKKPAAPKQDDVAAMLDAWARAWSRQDVNEYLSYYDKDFVTPPGVTRAEWEKSRRARVGGPKSIAVSIAAAKISPPADGQVTVTFRQSYRSDHFKSNSTKTLVLVNVDGRWRIRQEKAAN